MVRFESCAASLVATDESKCVMEMGPCVVISPASRDGPGDMLRCGDCRPRVVCHRAALTSPGDCSPDGAECGRWVDDIQYYRDVID